MLNKLLLITILFISFSVNAKVKFCANSDVINSFLSKSGNIQSILDCAKESEKNNLGFKSISQFAFILDKEIDDKIFYFSLQSPHTPI